MAIRYRPNGNGNVMVVIPKVMDEITVTIHGGSRSEDCNVVILLSGPDAMICDDKFALVFEVKLENT